jgi:hypothetical protein
LKEVEQSTNCFTNVFPLVLGGTGFDTEFLTFDMDADKNMVVGGKTNAVLLASLAGAF